jgi:hypothetical protein
MMLDRLQREPFWAEEYEEFVRQVSFAPPDETISFAEPLQPARAWWPRSETANDSSRCSRLA